MQIAEAWKTLYLQSIDERDQLRITSNQKSDKIMNIEKEQYELMCKLSSIGQDLIQMCREYNKKPDKYKYVRITRGENNAQNPQKVDLGPETEIRTNNLFGL